MIEPVHDRDELARCPDLQGVVDLSLEHLVLRVVEGSARVVEELVNGDRFATRDKPGEPVLD